MCVKEAACCYTYGEKKRVYREGGEEERKRGRLLLCCRRKSERRGRREEEEQKRRGEEKAWCEKAEGGEAVCVSAWGKGEGMYIMWHGRQ